MAAKSDSIEKIVAYGGEGWDAAYKVAPFGAKAETFYEQLQQGKSNPLPDVLIGWRENASSKRGAVYPALLNSLAIQFDVFQKQKVKMEEGKLKKTKWTADGSDVELRLPVIVFTGDEMQEHLIPEIIRYSITGISPASGALTSTIGRLLNDRMSRELCR